MGRLGLGLIASVSLLTVVPSSAMEDVAAPAMVKFEAIETKIDGSVQVVGGKTVAADNWRTLLIADLGPITLPGGKPGRKTCTAALVGPGVALTAAHCLDKGGKDTTYAAQLTVKDKDQTSLTLEMTCEIPAAYVIGDPSISPRTSADYALCRFKVPPAAPYFKGLRYEVLELTKPPSGQQKVVITGYGCKNVFMGAGGVEGSGYDNVFTIADAVIDDPDYQGLIEILSDGKTRPMICFGDSGGPLMIGMATKDDGPLVQRRILAVNSAIAPRYDYFASQMASLTQPAFTGFLAEWLLANSDAIVCGDPKRPLKSPCRN